MFPVNGAWLAPSQTAQHKAILAEWQRAYGVGDNASPEAMHVIQRALSDLTGRMNIADLNFAEANLYLEMLKLLPAHQKPDYKALYGNL